MRYVVGVVLALLTVVFGLLMLDLLVTKLTYLGNWRTVYALVVTAAASYGCYVGARKRLRRQRVASN